MTAMNHPFFFPLLKKMIVVTLRERNTTKITGKDKEFISEKSGVKKSYCERILVRGVYSSNASHVSVGEESLNKLVLCLPKEWQYDGWDTFCLGEQKEMKDKTLLYDLPNKDFEDLQESHQQRIREEIEFRAESYIQTLLEKTSSRKIEESSPIPKNVKSYVSSEVGNPAFDNEEKLETLKPIIHQKDQRNHFSWKWRVVILGLVIFISYSIFWEKKPTVVKEVVVSDVSDETSKIEYVIREAGRLEFCAYKAVPMDRSCFDTIVYSRNYITPCLQKFRKSYMPYLDSLSKYMTKKPLAKVRDVVGASVWKGWTMQNEYNMSRRKLLSIEKINVLPGDSIAYADSREECSIEWFDIDLGENVYHYSNPKQYHYILKKDAFQNWKIEGIEDDTPKRVIRKAIICWNLRETLVDAQTIRENILTALKGENLNTALKYIQCHCKQNEKPIPNRVHRTYIDLKRLYRNLNTGIILINAFDSQKTRLAEEFSTWFNNHDIEFLREEV